MFADHPEPWLYNQWAWQRPGRDDAVVELHWALAAPQVPQPRACDLIARAQRVRCGALEVQALSDADQLLHACYHFHHHAGVLKALLDVASWCDRFGAGAAPSLAIEEASRWGVRGLVAWPVGAIGALDMQARWPWEVQIASRSTKRSRALSAWSARATRGALGQARGEEGASGFKTGKVAQAQVVAWRQLLCRDALAALNTLIHMLDQRLAGAVGKHLGWKADGGVARRDDHGKIETHTRNSQQPLI